ncbi:MAG: GIY-YIG nuclease family protein [Acidobacteriota bacterium]|nr:MAG: GIY-YIG nuclease family protein [Acidobacteriota bacterium]
MYYTYVLESVSQPDQRYIGHTSDLRKRLAEHNAGSCLHTRKYRPWKIKLYLAFEEIDRARDFERYLKSGSGHAFGNRHLW